MVISVFPALRCTMLAPSGNSKYFTFQRCASQVDSDYSKWKKLKRSLCTVCIYKHGREDNCHLCILVSVHREIWLFHPIPPFFANLTKIRTVLPLFPGILGERNKVTRIIQLHTVQCAKESFIILRGRGSVLPILFRETAGSQIQLFYFQVEELQVIYWRASCDTDPSVSFGSTIHFVNDRNVSYLLIRVFPLLHHTCTL